MIPKIIHYCWFGGKPKPSEFYKWLETWKTVMPDYEIIEWNEENFDINFCNYSREAYLTENFAHVSDVCRVYALYKYGGIYLDTDVEIVKPFNNFLSLRAFVSIERPLIGTAVMASKAGMYWLERFLGYYKNTHFINIWGHTVRTPNTKILTYRVLPKIGLADWPTIFPRDFFAGIINKEGKAERTDNTVALHHFAGSWLRKKTKKQKITSIIEGLVIRYLRTGNFKL